MRINHTIPEAHELFVDFDNWIDTFSLNVYNADRVLIVLKVNYS